MAKCLEKLLLFQMLDQINENSLLNIEQFGFQNKKSSTDAVLFFTETVIENHENEKNAAACFLDLAKAFNSLSHKIFLKKQSVSTSVSLQLIYWKHFSKKDHNASK